MGVVWFLVSLLISPILLPVGLLFGFFKQCYNNSFRKALTDIDNKFMNMAVSVDKFGNVVCAELFNATLIKKSKNLFGNHRQTVSHVLGVNVRSGNLTTTGKGLNDALNFIEKDHSVKSIEE
jgi:8-oxo-dGTP diphosphatase